jgi:hypothetical protein
VQAPSDEDEESDFQLVHGAGGGSAQDLPPGVQRVLAALEHNQARLCALAAAAQVQRSKLKAQQADLRRQLGQQRRSGGLLMCGQARCSARSADVLPSAC